MSACCGTVVGAVIERDGLYLTHERVKPPWGVASVAGHDDHGSTLQSLAGEVFEEAGLTVTGSRLLLDHWIDTACGRGDGPQGRGHHWRVYAVNTVGDPHGAPAEVRNMCWRTPAELQALADLTVRYAGGGVSDGDWASAPGLEPVWLFIYRDLGVIDVAAADGAVVAELAQRPVVRL